MEYGLTQELYLSIAKGDMHVYIVCSYEYGSVEICHLGHLVHNGVETRLRFEDPNREFIDTYPVGKTVWMALRKREWEICPVTTMDDRARQEVETAKRLLFKGSGSKEITVEKLVPPSGKNPRQ